MTVEALRLTLLKIVNMMEYNFYEIKSQKSKEFVKGLRKVCLVCENRPDIHCFLWVNQEEKLQHLQFLFDENLIEWFEERKELITAQTNRKDYTPFQTGVHKGVRTIQSVQNSSIMEEGLEILKSAQFPDQYGQLIRPTFTET